MSASQRSGQGSSPLVDRLDDTVRRVAHAMVIAAGWGTLSMGLLIAVDVLWRAMTGRNLGGVDEIAGYLFAIGISWSLAGAFHARAHIRVDILYQKLPPFLRVILDISAMISLLIVAVFLCFSSWLVVDTSWMRDARSASSMQVPLIIPQALWLFGAAVFAVSLSIALLRSFSDILAGRPAAILARHGVSTVDEEAEDAVLQSRGAN